MKILELFAGSRSIGKEAEKQGYKVFSVDWTNYDNIDLVIDIEKLKLSDIPFVPDMVWASPDCTTYSIAAISHHRNGLLPKTNYAKKCDLVNIHMHSLIKEWLKINPNLKYYIENPRGIMHKMPFVKNIPYTVVWYCKYGDMRAKPTTIFSNNIRGLFNPDGWQPREQCFNSNTKCHHESAPRGSRTGTQGKKGSYERSKIPKELCEEVISATVNSC
tara:strand:- start:1080 stop:1730 length:651 start_codon:yes stop_codon:yes gene_type:complete